MTGSVDQVQASTVELFREIHLKEWAWRLGEIGTQHFWTATQIDDFLSDVSPEAQTRRQQYWEETLVAVRDLNREELSREYQTDYDVYIQQLEVLINQQRMRMFERPANADTSFWNELLERGRRKLETVQQAENYLAQLKDLPRYVQQNIENMRAGVRRGFGPSQITMQGREQTIRSVVEAIDPRKTAFFEGISALPESIPAAQRQELQDKVANLVTNEIRPSFETLLTFLTEEYFPSLPTEISAVTMHGEEFYKTQLEEFTTTDLGPQEIFDIGMREVQSIRAEMEKVAHSVGFAGDVDALLEFMRTDPQFYVDEPEKLLREAAWQAKKFDAIVDQFFGHTPRQRFAIVEPPADVAPFYTFGRGGVDRYILNTYGLENRPLYSLPALTLHEAAPGHAFQIPLALEQTNHPEFRRHVYISAYGEGWGLYSERLGVEMGIYETPYEFMGMLSYQMWRAVRLVVDPGMHAFGWSREKAQAFLRDNTAIGEHEIITEIDRYIAWPGQAASYYLGQLKIQELREYASNSLGEDFSLRAFHDTVLSLGSVPLAVLETEIKHFVANGGRSPFDAAAN